MTSSKQEQREDKEAELETLRSVKVFLTDKLKQNDQITADFLAGYRDSEGGSARREVDHDQDEGLLQQKDSDIKTLRQEFLESDTKLREQVNMLTIKQSE
eukprot:CAMPEP_0170461970 /NCGR_PEP_ID=MMETSP0123-20130129/7662_1 /TAXON_ID=182087 /ORGANISM="Favella ehrenbergii, Strain Fehren 1" /LENGTH=99 /DNA_ID=CAMNT_0010727095 /DNA_START=636 /DNA_END=935 /DNA_ORIENTATION=+